MKHTQPEYLAWIDDKLEQIEEASSVYGAPTGDGYRASLLGNRDVLVRHEPKLEFGDNKCDECRAYLLLKNDRDGLYWVTCPTRTDITKRLDEVMG